MSTGEVKVSEFVMVPVDAVTPHELNPNVMTDDQFNELCVSIQNSGFDEPLQVVKRDKADPSEPDSYLCIGGHNRLRAAKALGLEQIPVSIKEWDSLEAKMQLARRNVVRGTLDAAKFTKLVEQITAEEQGLDQSEVARRMGFTSEDEFARMYHKKVEEQRAEANQAATTMLEETKTELRMVENVSFVLNEIFSKFGKTVPQGFIFFFHGKQCHLAVQCDKPLQELTKKLAAATARDNAKINDFLVKALEAPVNELIGAGAPPTPAEDEMNSKV